MTSSGRACSLLGALAFVSCGMLCVPGSDDELERRLESRLAELSKSGQGQFSLVEVGGFNFDYAYAFAPYTSSDTIQKSIGFKWDCSDSLSLQNSEDRGVFVFVRGGKVIKFAFCSTRYGLFTIELYHGMPPDAAVVSLRTREDGLPMIEWAQPEK